MSYIPIEYNQHTTGWFCQNDLILVCDRIDENESLFMDEKKFPRRYIPKVNFNDKELFPSSTRRSNLLANEDILSELNSMLACREYVRKQNHFFDRKQFQRAEEEEKKIKRRQHPSYISRFDEKRYVRKKKSSF